MLVTDTSPVPPAYYTERLRVRVVGMCLKDHKLLLLKHQGFGPMGHLWAPPGGEVQFGESLSHALRREFEEETGLQVEIQAFLYLHEHLVPPLHALECFFAVKHKSGKLKIGNETATTGVPVLEEARYFSISELKALPSHTLHSLLQNIRGFSALFLPQGQHTFGKLKKYS